MDVSTDGRKKGCYTFLIAGKDRAAGLTDTVLVGMLDTENKSLKFVSIPRDTAVNVAYRPKKMNQYYAAAENNGKDGVEALIGGAEQILGYRVDSYALFDVEVFVELIDAMGGIDFDVPVDMDYDDPSQNLSIHVQKGYQHLNGYQTMGVFRFRNTYANGDIGRIDVQHQMLKAMMSQFLKLHNIPNLNKLIDIYEKEVTTNLSAGNVMFYVKEFLKLDESAISFETIPANYNGVKNGMSYVFIHVDEWLEYLNTMWTFSMNPMGRSWPLPAPSRAQTNGNEKEGCSIMMPANELAAVIVKALDAKKGENIQLLKTRELTTLADYFVICTASSSTHVKTLTDAVEAAADDVGEPVLRREGHRSGSWVLLDYGCVIVHVFQDEARKFYDLERLWSDAEVVDISDMRA